MKHEQHDHGDAGIAEIWRNANHCRTQDVRCLITKILKTMAVQITRRRKENVLGKTLQASSDSLFSSGKTQMTGRQSG